MVVTRRGCLRLGAALVAMPLTGMAAAAPVVTVLAAASLIDALTEVITAFAGISPVRVRPSFAASSVLARQIESGAPADIFVSADREWMDELQSRGLIRAQSRRDLLGNRLVLVVPRASSLALKIAPGPALRDALGDGRWVTGDPDSVPVGRYARAALKSLDAWDALVPRLVPADNVRSALALVARGEVAFGVVYATDATVEPRVRVVDVFAAATHPPIVYPAALTRDASSAAASFLDYLQGAAAAAVFRRYGFLTGSP